MLRTRLRSGTGILCFVMATAMVFTVDTAPADDNPDSTASTPAAATPQPASDNVTRSVTIHTPSVAVRTNPAQASQSPGRNAAHGAAQHVFVDQNGNVLSSPPPGTQVPQLPPRSQADPTPYRSSVYPDTLLLDTTHIRAVTSARINENGRVEMICRDDHDAPDHECEIHPSKSAQTGEQSAEGKSMKEDR